MSTKISTWPAATPLWVDLGVDDLTAAKSFYAEPFGWDFVSGGKDPADYVLAHLRGRAVAGIGPKQDPACPQSGPRSWPRTMLTLTAKKIVAAGGQLLAPPFDVMDSGRMALALTASVRLSASGRPAPTSELNASMSTDPCAGMNFTRGLFRGPVLLLGGLRRQLPGRHRRRPDLLHPPPPSGRPGSGRGRTTIPHFRKRAQPLDDLVRQRLRGRDSNPGRGVGRHPAGSRGGNHPGPDGSGPGAAG